MMWAPIANNLVAITVLGSYVVLFGSSDGCSGFSAQQASLLGIGPTLGIATQAAILVPYLRRAGFRFRPRFDFRGTGLGKTLRLGGWTLGFIVANQVAYIVVQRLGTSGTLTGAAKTMGCTVAHGTAAAGSAVYEIGYLMSQMPHGVITVSLATAIIPTLSSLAADREYTQLGRELARALRLVLAVITPLALAAAVLGPTAVHAIAFGGVRANAGVIGWTVAAFAPAMVAFSVHYVMLRGYYAMENTRTPFLIQLAVASTNILAAIGFTHLAEPRQVPIALAFAFGLSYAVGATLSATFLPASAAVMDAQMRQFGVRLAGSIACAALVMLAVLAAVHSAGVLTDTPGRALGVVALVGPLGAGTYLLASRWFGITEFSDVLAALRRRR